MKFDKIKSVLMKDKAISKLKGNTKITNFTVTFDLKKEWKEQ